MRNPLIKRIPKELASDWHKYLVIILFMVIMIAVISGMYIGHDSMLFAIEKGRTELKLEDGSFELKEKATPELLKELSKGEKADVRQYYIDEGNKEADEKVEEAIEDKLNEQVRNTIEETVRAQCTAAGITDEAMIKAQTDKAIDDNLEQSIKETQKTKDFKEAKEKAYKEAHEEVIKKVDEKWDDIAEEYGLNDTSFKPVQVSIHEDFYREASEDNDNDGKEDAVVRIFPAGKEVNRAAMIEGREPANADEIAIDRMHADNVGVKTGDSITIQGKKFKITGLLSYVNYLTLHEKNTDLMFDAFGFDVAMLTPEAFDSLNSRLHYNYSFVYKDKPADKVEKADKSENFLKALITQSLVADNELDNYLPEYLRQASNFAPSDIEGDSTGASILCYILIAVIAFIFAVTISNTIDKEASVIGTLRASGYSRSELVVHYMSMPLIVTLIGALIGNILGYTVFRNLALSLYYNSYSLPKSEPVWNQTAFIKTTVIPLLLMFFINLFVIVKKLQLSPLKFLRHDLTKSKRTKARRLPSWSFLRRFRLRILFQNMPNYAILIFGVVFIELMMCFAFGMPDALNNYGDRAPDMVFADYQYMLMGYKDDDGKVIETDEESAERFSSKDLLYPKAKSSFREGMGSGGDEGVTVYGIADNSRYIDLPGENVYISEAFRQKFNIKEGSTITLNEEYENKSYELKVDGFIDYEGGIAVFMPNDRFNELFGKKKDEFSGYFSKKEIKDIDENDIAVVITAEDISKVTVQLMHSFGRFIAVFKYALILLTAALIYLLAKIIIERNERSISMVKILGFKNSEISSLYILPTAIVVALFSVLGFVAGYFLMNLIFKVFMLQMDGYFSFFMKPSSMICSILYLLIGYLFVSVIDYFRIKKIPMDEALKNID